MHRVVRITLAVVAVLVAIPAMADIVINEIMYNTPGSDVEWIELYNTGPNAQDLTSWYLLDSDPTHPPCALVGTLAAGDYLVVAADFLLFNPQYPDVTNLNPNDFDPDGAGFGLGNGGDTVNLYNDDDEIIDFVEYDDGGDWPGSPDGDGPSLELINPALDNNVSASWNPSTVDWGTPGVINSTFANDNAPICRNGDRNLRLPSSEDAVYVTVEAFDDNALVSIELMVDLGSGYVAQPMFDDGMHGDGAAADSIYGSVIAPQPSGALVKMYAIAEDNIGQTDMWPGDGPADYVAYTVDHVSPVIVVNEIIASNDTGMQDEMGEFEDWIELYNPGTEDVDLSGMCLSDEFGNRDNWEIPAGTVLSAGGYMTFWADNDEEDGPLHADFKLSGGGEEVAIYDTRDHGRGKIHGFKYGPVAADVAIGYSPDLGSGRGAYFDYGFAPEYLTTPTPGASNISDYYSAVCINEFQAASSAGEEEDWIELYNRGDVAVDIGGCFLSDERDVPNKYMIPEGTVLEADSYIVFHEVDMLFGFGSTGEVALFTAIDGENGLDFYDFGDQEMDISEGRTPNGVGTWGFFEDPTPGAANPGEESGVENPIPGTLKITGIVPNPFNPRTEIRFSLPTAEEVSVQVFDVTGRLVNTLHNGNLDSGDHALVWNGRNSKGAAVGSGVYFAKVKNNTSTKTQKMLLLK